MARALPRLALLSVLAACTSPPPGAYVGGHSGGGIKLGDNASHEACTAQPTSGQSGFDIFCGNWDQPSAHAERGAHAEPGALAALAAASPWRAGIDQHFTCAEPTPTRVLGGTPALLLNCTRKFGGWPQIALATIIDGRTYTADGILPAMPVIERAIGVLSGRVSAAAAPAMPGSEVDALAARRLAAQAFGASDVGQFEALMEAGTRANLAENYAAAEQAFRAALAVQRKVLGADAPATANPLMHLALQISDQGRFAEADSLFAEAARLAARAEDPAIDARLLHYRGLDAIDQRQWQVALDRLQRATAAYAALLPPDALAAGPRPTTTAAPSLAISATPTTLPGSDVLLAPATETALAGLIETLRYQAIALRGLGRLADSRARIQAAADLAAANGLHQPVLAARLYRTTATTAGAAGMSGVALTGLSLSTAAFSEALPGSRPIAETELLHAAELARAGHEDAALERCRHAATLLRQLRSGTDFSLLAPCLALYDDAATRDAAHGQALRGEMFEMAELAQGSTTSRQIALAAARLGANAKDKRVGEAIRRRQDAGELLAALYHERDTATAGVSPPPGLAPPRSPAELDSAIAAAQTALADADAALQAAAPNYGQLVQQVAPAAEVLAALAPGEAFAAIMLGGDEGFVFVLRQGRIDTARVPLGETAMAALVARLRASVEPGANGVPRFDTEAARQIHAATLGRLPAALGGADALVVAPTGPLLAIPFAMLLTGPADPDRLEDAPWLMRRMSITHVPAAANFVALRRIAATSRASRPWFGFGDFRPVTLAQAERTFPGSTCADAAKLFAGLPPLPFAGRELAAARALLGGSPGDELLGAHYTAAAVIRADLAAYHVLHFASHALLPAELTCESEPAIVTSAPSSAPDASGALLSASAVTGLDLDADLVILSACNTGGPGEDVSGGGSTGGESLSGLARSFFYAGARALMVTHWAVNDQASAFLVADTLRLLRGGKTGAAGALRQAELDLIATAGKGAPAALAHPFYWAPFALIGESGGRFAGERRVSGL